MAAEESALGATPLQSVSLPCGDGTAASARSLAIAFFAVCAMLGTFVAALSYLGSAADGSPVVSIEIGPFPRNSGEGRVASGSSFVEKRMVSGNLVADPALIEDSAMGPLPVVAPDGREPMSAYAMPYDRNDKRPKIAVVVGGLGVGVGATDAALTKLPPQVTLAFTPFDNQVQTYVDKARGLGHEVLLQVPMEPFDFPDSDPGPHALLANASAEENISRLYWSMTRFTGYAGISNLLGARFMGEAGAIEPVMAEAAKRGLLFFDTGASSRSLAATAARHVNAAIATGTLVLDTIQNQTAIDGKLGDLEAQARRDGSAIGVASLYPISVARVSEWAARAGERGYLVVPVSALAMRPAAAASVSAR